MPTNDCRTDHLISKAAIAQGQNLCDVQVAIAQEQTALLIFALVFDYPDQQDGLRRKLYRFYQCLA